MRSFLASNEGGSFYRRLLSSEDNICEFMVVNIILGRVWKTKLIKCIILTGNK